MFKKFCNKIFKTITDHVASATLFDHPNNGLLSSHHHHHNHHNQNQNHYLQSISSATSTTTGSPAGVTWWSVMNSTPYEDSLTQNAATPVSNSGMTSPIAAKTVPLAIAPPQPKTSSSNTSVNSPTSVPINNNNNNNINNNNNNNNNNALSITPNHIKRSLSAYECNNTETSSSSLRQNTWSYAENHNNLTNNFENVSLSNPNHNHHHHQYSTHTPTYYNFSDPSRDNRKSATAVSFWSPAVTATTGIEYKYSPNSTVTPSTGSSTTSANIADPPVSSCHQNSFAAQSWCNYSPYTTSRHHVDPHPGQPVTYLSPADDRTRAVAAAAMVAAENAAAGFSHESYALRNYPGTESVTTPPYPPPGKLFFEAFSNNRKTDFIFLSSFYVLRIFSNLIKISKSFSNKKIVTFPCVGFSVIFE